MIDRALGAVAVAAVAACTSGPVRGTVHYTVEGGAIDRGVLVVESAAGADAEWQAFTTRWRAACPSGPVDTVELDRAAVEADPATPLDGLFRSEVWIAARTAAPGEREHVAIARGRVVGDRSRLVLTGLWAVDGRLPAAHTIRVSGGPAATAADHLPARLIVTLALVGRCRRNL